MNLQLNVTVMLCSKFKLFRTQRRPGFEHSGKIQVSNRPGEESKRSGGHQEQVNKRRGRQSQGEAEAVEEYVSDQQDQILQQGHRGGAAGRAGHGHNDRFQAQDHPAPNQVEFFFVIFIRSVFLLLNRSYN